MVVSSKEDCITNDDIFGVLLFDLYLIKWKYIFLSSEYLSTIIPSVEELYTLTLSISINIVVFISLFKHLFIYS